MNLIDIMRNPSKGSRAVVSGEVISRIRAQRPKPRMGRMAFYAQVANELGVTVNAITTAMQRAK